MHAIATVVADCRAQPGERGLVWANGGFCTKHAFGVYSTEPPSGGFRHDDVQAAVDALPRVEVVADLDGPATIEGYTVIHGRDGLPERAFAAVPLPRPPAGLGLERRRGDDGLDGRDRVGRHRGHGLRRDLPPRLTDSTGAGSPGPVRQLPRSRWPKRHRRRAAQSARSVGVAGDQVAELGAALEQVRRW